MDENLNSDLCICLELTILHVLIQVHKQGIAVGRSVDLTKFNGYSELIAELDQIFDFNGELIISLNKEWSIVFTDDEGDMMLVGDDPWL